MKRVILGTTVAGLVLVGLLVVAGGIVYAYGTTLPVHHTASVTAVVPASPEAVFDLIRDPVHGPRWRADVARVEMQGLTRWVEHGEDVLTFEVRVAERPHRFVTEVVEHPDFGGTWTWELAPEGDGTRVHLTEDGEVYSPLFRGVMTLMSWESANIETRLQELDAAFADP